MVQDPLSKAKSPLFVSKKYLLEPISELDKHAEYACTYVTFLDDKRIGIMLDFFVVKPGAVGLATFVEGKVGSRNAFGLFGCYHDGERQG